MISEKVKIKRAKGEHLLCSVRVHVGELLPGRCAVGAARNHWPMRRVLRLASTRSIVRIDCTSVRVSSLHFPLLFLLLYYCLHEYERKRLIIKLTT